MKIVVDIPKEKYEDPASIDLYYMLGLLMNGTIIEADKED